MAQLNFKWLHFSFIVAMNLALIVLGAGCQSNPPLESPSTITSSTFQTAQASGIEVGLDPFFDRRRTLRVFGVDSSQAGIGIVFARVSNHTLNQTFLVEKKGFHLFIPNLADKSLQNHDSLGQLVAAASISTMMDKLMIVFIQGPVGLAIAEENDRVHATEVTQKFVSKEMQDQTLSPGESVEGFVYFPLDAKSNWFHGSSMKITMAEIKSHEILSMTLPLSQ